MSERLREVLDKFKKLYREEGPNAAVRWWEVVVGQNPELNREWSNICRETAIELM